MLVHNYTRRHNEIIKYLQKHLYNKYKFANIKRLKNYSEQDILDNENVEIRIDIRLNSEI